MPEKKARVRAPELEANGIWLNTAAPLRLSQFRGKMVLLDFWTHCCINCHHVLRDLEKLEKKYPTELVVIGVHVAKFDNERGEESLRQAVLRHRINHPVVSDVESRIWQSYTVKAWPTLVLIDPEGYIVDTLPGEGHFDFLDELIGQLAEVFDEAGQLSRAPLPAPAGRQEAPRGTLHYPGKILADPRAGRLFISDTNHNRVLMTNLEGEILSVFGNGKPGFSDGNSDVAALNRPQGLALHGDRLYVADTENHALRWCDLNTGSVETVAGNGLPREPFGPWQIEAADRAELNSPWDLCLEGDYLFVAMAGLHQIWLLDLCTGEIGPYAGSGSEGLRDGSLVDCMLAQPSGLASNGSHLFVADSESSAVRAVPYDTRLPVTTVVGAGLFEFGDRDGSGSEVRLQHPLGLAVHPQGLWVADTYNHKVKLVIPARRSARTIVGEGVPGFEDGRSGKLNEPGGLAMVGESLFIADTNNHAIRRLREGGGLETLQIAGLGT